MRKGSDAATGHLWSVSITQGSVHQNPQNYPWDSYHFPPRSEETKAEHGQGSCYTRSQRCLQSQGGLAGLQSPASTRETAPPLCGMCPHIQDEAWNPQCFRKAKRKMSHLLSTEAGSAAHLLQRGHQGSPARRTTWCRRGSRGPAFAPLQKQNHLQQFAPMGPPALESSVAEVLPWRIQLFCLPCSSSSPSPEDDTLGPGYPLGGPAGQAFPCRAV